jgi:hypothetical protein
MLSSLERIEDQLIAAAESRSVRWRTRRRRGMATVALVGVLGVATGASAITGIGPFDTRDEGAANVFPRTNAAQQALVFRTRDDRQWVARAFLGTGNAYCVQAPPVNAATQSEARCLASSDVEAQFQAHEPVVVVAPVVSNQAGGEPQSLVAGLVSSDVTNVSVTNERTGTSADATISSVWTQGAEPAARAFLVALPQVDVGGTPQLSISLETTSGRHTAVWPPSGTRP